MATEELTWRWQGFHDLLPQRLYDILRLRQQVFVVEQECCYEDIDLWDQSAAHLLGTTSGGEVVAYCRVLAPDVRFPEASIGRVLTAVTVRRRGFGHELVRHSVAFCHEHYPGSAIRISAQTHLEPFYRVHGFKVCGQEYSMDGITHVDMFSPGNATAI